MRSGCRARRHGGCFLAGVALIWREPFARAERIPLIDRRSRGWRSSSAFEIRGQAQAGVVVRADLGHCLCGSRDVCCACRGLRCGVADRGHRASGHRGGNAFRMSMYLDAWLARQVATGLHWLHSACSRWRCPTSFSLAGCAGHFARSHGARFVRTDPATAVGHTSPGPKRPRRGPLLGGGLILLRSRCCATPLAMVRRA